MRIRRSNERGHANHGWLDSHHTFSFADYFDPEHMHFRALRVINEDRVAAGEGFPRHGHRDMEIVTYVLDGALEHQDSMGNGSVIRPGDVQRMSAGTGVSHSEYNASKTDPVHFLQIWIMPDRAGHAPGYEQRSFSREDRADTLRVVASPDGRDGSVKLNQDAVIRAALLGKESAVEHHVAKGRHAWIHVAKGAVDVGGEKLASGDAAAIDDAGVVRIRASEPSEVLVFDLA
ncbi:MAG: pirin family protein [Polyangiaceae bacterium]